MTGIAPSGEAPVDEGLAGRNLITGAWLWIGADAFFFMAIFFAFVYLRALNTNHMWNPTGENPSGTLGTITLVVVLAATGLVALGMLRLRRGQPWAVFSAVALALILAAIVLQGWQLFDPGFSPSHAGAYGSVFVAFTAAYLLHLLGAGYVLETILVGFARSARDPEVGAADLPASYEAFALFWYLLAAMFVIFFVLLYLVH
jgi:heme/copper-type cytochrome/quinol oxidase subunit 3